MKHRRRRVARVLFVNHVAELSGAERSLLELLTNLDRRRFEPFVACPEGELARRVREVGVRHIPVGLRRISRSRTVGDTLHAEPWAYDLRTGKQRTRIHPVTGRE